MFSCHPHVLSHRCTVTSFPSTFIPNFTTPFTLASLSQIRLINSISLYLPHNMCLHRAHYLDFHPVSVKHVFPISTIKFSSNTTRNIHSTITFAYISSKVFQPVCYLWSVCISHSPEPSTHFILPYFYSSHSSYTSIILCQQHIYFSTSLKLSVISYLILPYQMCSIPTKQSSCRQHLVCILLFYLIEHINTNI